MEKPNTPARDGMSPPRFIIIDNDVYEKQGDFTYRVCAPGARATADYLEYRASAEEDVNLHHPTYVFYAFDDIKRNPYPSYQRARQDKKFCYRTVTWNDVDPENQEGRY